jgi:Protein of unknown function (DUF3126)
MTRDELNQLEKYLRKTFQTDTIEVKPRLKKKDSAEVYVGEEQVAFIYRDDEDDEVSYQLEMDIKGLDLKDIMTRDELNSLEKHLRKTFQTDTIEVKPRPKKKDSAEVYVDDEFMAVIYCGHEDEKVPYKFQMAILETDLG